MKRINWFVCLSYPNFDVLLPKEDILSSSYIKDDLDSKAEIINFDSLINPDAEISFQTKNRTQLEINGEKKIILQTSIIPDLVSASLSEFRVFGDKLGKTLLENGFISARFVENRIQYLIDINAILKRGTKNKKQTRRGRPRGSKNRKVKND